PATHVVLHKIMHYTSSHHHIHTLSLHDALPIFATEARIVSSSSGRSERISTTSHDASAAISSAARSHTGTIAPYASSVTSSPGRSEEHTSELQSPCNLVCRLLLVKKKTTLKMYL